MEHDKTAQQEQEKKSDIKTYLLFGLVGLVLIVSLAQSFQINSLKKEMKSQVTANAVSGGIDMSGWTEDEKMLYEHHGTLPARAAQGNNQNPQAGMVGGC